MTLVEAIKPDILDLLASGNKNLAELTSHLKPVSYYTVRNAVKDLVNDRAIVPMGYPGTRNMPYGLKDQQGFTPSDNNTIPRVIIGGKSHRLNTLLELRNHQETAASIAALNVPKYITKLCTLAQRYDSEGSTNTLSLEALRVEMTRDYEALLKTADLYKQILRNKRNWDPEQLATWLKDPAFDEKEVKDSHEHYSSE